MRTTRRKSRASAMIPAEARHVAKARHTRCDGVVPNVSALSTTQSTAGVGAVIAEKYELLHILGRGSMGEVWLARHNTLFENVAIKLLAPWAWTAANEDPGQALARFRLEARIAAHLARKTRHIVQVTDHGEVGDTAYIVMELLEGSTLEAKLSRGANLPLESVQELVRQVARALECAHAERVLHRDLKPANVFLTRGEDGEMLVKVLDFGIARIMRETAVTGSASRDGDLIFGTPGYMSPEQSLGDDLDARCDLWALATIAFEALTNELPVPGLTANDLVNAVRKARTVPLNQYRPDLPESMAAFFERAFAKSAADRFATAAELTCAFDAACISTTRRSPPVGSTPRPRAASSIRLPRRRHPIAKAMALLALLVTGLVGVTSNWRTHHGFWFTLSPSALALPQASANTPVAPATPAPLPTASVEAKPEVAPVEAANMTPPLAPPASPVSIVRVVGEKHRRARRPVPVPADVNVGVDVDVVPVTASRVPDAVSDDTAAATQSARAATSIASSGSVLGCTPPYEVDATGKKHWKLECL